MKKILTLLMSAFVLFAFAQDPGSKPEGFKDNFSSRDNGLLPIYTVTGKYILSADGAGSTSASMNISVEKPSADATVHKAILMGASTGFSNYQIPNGCITLAGSAVNWTSTIASSIISWNSYADVTSIVAPVVDPAAPGIINLTVTECNTSGIDGTALLVVFADPDADSKTIFILFGAASTAGDNFSINLAAAIDPSDPASIFDMGLGISFGFQTPTVTDQISIIDVNGQRLTTSAGGQDDGQAANGALITVGGVGDSNTNPPPFAAPTNFDFDDELYSILPLITNTTTNVLVSTVNPSDDDNIFLAYFVVTGEATLGPPPEVPVSNWALYLGILLMITFVVFRFRKMI
jgi:hypothetical protein